MPPEEPTDAKPGRQPLPPAKRKRLQQCFEHGSRNSTQGNFDYATEMFTQCVVGDPGNLIYFQNFLGNLQKKYDNNKKGGKLAGLKGKGAKSAIKRATSKENWTGVIKAGCELLKLNPWDATALTAMANACEELECDDCQLLCLKTALDANPKGPDINRLSGLALERVGRFDEAIICWHRVEQAKPGDLEAPEMIGRLTVERTIHQGGYREKIEDTEQGAATSGKSSAPVETDGSAPASVSREQKLEREMTRHPDVISNYLELAELHVQAGSLDQAAEVLEKGLQASGGGDLTVREKLEDVQLEHGLRQLAIAEQRAADEGTDQAATLAKRIKSEVNQRELEIYHARCERNPGNAPLRFEFGVRLKKAGKFKEAIQAFQTARNDPKRRANTLLELGECFHHSKRYELAMTNYVAAIEAAADRDADTEKLARYRAGVLAMGLKEWEEAKTHLTTLADLDYGYRDVAERLDKIAQMRKDS